MKKDGVEPSMPPSPAPHIIERLIEIGLTGTTGMGVAPLSWGEIVAWQEAVGVSIAPWEARLIRRLSAAYVVESRRAESEGCPPPWWRHEVTEAERAAELAGLQSVLG